MDGFPNLIAYSVTQLILPHLMRQALLTDRFSVERVMGEISPNSDGRNLRSPSCLQYSLLFTKVSVPEIVLFITSLILRNTSTG
jgi:hypothetical protein